MKREQDNMKKKQNPFQTYEIMRKDGSITRISRSPKKEESKQKEKFSLTGTFKNWATNINYKIDSMSNTVELDCPLMYLGKRYEVTMQTALDRHISETFWFSYREKMPPIMENAGLKNSLTCDRGWGCMIRCGQMLLAEGIKRHYQKKGEMIEAFKKESLLSILFLFADFIQDELLAPFSIQQICSVAYKHYGSKPGEWYRSSSVMMSLDKLNENFGHRRINNMRICVFNEGTIYEDKILEKAMNFPEEEKMAEKDKIATKQKEEIKVEDPRLQKENGTSENENMNINNKESGEKQNGENDNPNKVNAQQERPNNEEWKNSILIFLSTKTGLNEHNVLYLPTIAKLLKFPQCLGILGGKDTKGYYFLGFQNGTLLYLDPHFVQDAAKNYEEIEAGFKTYFRKKVFQIPVSEVDTSIGFGFYIKDAEEFKDFKQRMKTAMSGDPNFLVAYEEVTPDVDYKPEDIIEISGFQNEDAFEILH